MIGGHDREVPVGCLGCHHRLSFTFRLDGRPTIHRWRHVSERMTSQRPRRRRPLRAHAQFPEWKSPTFASSSLDSATRRSPNTHSDSPVGQQSTAARRAIYETVLDQLNTILDDDHASRQEAAR